ncbi:MAG: O-antigen ligase family protein [Hyphomonadaceae bacterium]|nr:O-antigen ligase family protein [Hyphomonadaceae bacterium]
MPFLVAVAFVTFLGCAVAGLDRDAARALTATGHGCVALAAIVWPRTRVAVFEVLKRLALPAGLFAALVLQGAVMSGAFYFGASATPWRAEQAMVALTGAGFFFVATAGIATAMGRNRLTGAMLWIPVVLSVLTLFDWFDGQGDFFGLVTPNPEGRVQGPFSHPNESATAFALFALFAAFAAVDELTRRPAHGPEAASAPTLTRRLILPGTAMLASLNMLALSGSRAGIAAGVAGLAVFFFFAWRRGLKGRAGPRIVPLAAGGVAIMALVVAAASGGGALRRFIGAPRPDYYADMTTAAMRAWREKPVFGHGMGAYDVLPAGEDGAPFDALRWLAETGLFGVALLTGALGVLLWRLWRAEDHGRKPSRGYALAAAVTTVALVHGAATSAMAAPAAVGVLAALMGVACAYIDPVGQAMKVKPTARTRVLG